MEPPIMGAPEDDAVMGWDIIGLGDAIMLGDVIMLVEDIMLVGDIIGLEDEEVGDALFEPQPARASMRTPAPATAAARGAAVRRIRGRTDVRWDMGAPFGGSSRAVPRAEGSPGNRRAPGTGSAAGRVR